MKPTFARTIAPLLLSAAAAPLAAQSGTFELPPNPTPTADPNVQGPVDPDRPILTRPRAPTPTPTPTPAPRATPAPTPTPTAAATREPGTRFTPAAPTTREARPENDFTPATRAQPPVLPEDLSAENQSGGDPAADPLPQLPAAAPATAAAADEETGGFPWMWALLGLLGFLAAGAAAFFVLRKREEAWAEPAPIEPPLARRAFSPPATSAGDAPLAPVVPLMVEAQALTLSRSMMYATLAYELRLKNRGPAPLTDIRLGGDLVTAHSRVPVDQQLADPAVPLEIIQRVDELGAGEHTVLKGEMRLPVSEIRLIPQGSAALYVPLLRLRIEAEGLAPFARTFVVGMRPQAPGGKLQPFRLDDMPQTYRQIAQRALD